MRFNIRWAGGEDIAVESAIPRISRRRKEVEEKGMKKTGWWGGESYLDENPLISIHRHF
jgi:hypothetical protein